MADASAAFTVFVGGIVASVIGAMVGDGSLPPIPLLIFWACHFKLPSLPIALPG
jgi:hypothetical protein